MTTVCCARVRHLFETRHLLEVSQYVLYIGMESMALDDLEDYLTLLDESWVDLSEKVVN